MTIRLLHLLVIFLSCTPLMAQTIAEKKAGMGVMGGDDLSQEMKVALLQVNQDLDLLQGQLNELYGQVQVLWDEQAPECAYSSLLRSINVIRDKIVTLQENWQGLMSDGTREAGYALWNQPDTTIGQLVNDFGSHHFLYMASPEISKIKISLDSNLPIPRASWDEILELVLRQSGIGIRQLNPYVRELYPLRSDLSNPQLITGNRHDLKYFPPTDRVVFVLSPPSSELKRVWFFLEKFINPNTTALQMIGRDILVVATVAEINDLLKIYDFVASHRGDKEYKAVKVNKVDVEEMARILAALFESIHEESGEMMSPPMPGRGLPMPGGPGGAFPQMAPRKGADRAGPPQTSQQGQDQRRGGPQQVHGNSSLRIITLKDIARALFLVGTKEEIRQAEEIIQQVENQVGATRKKEIFWYKVKHSDPEELAQILARIYELMVFSNVGFEEEFGPNDLPISPQQRAFEIRDTVRNDVVEAVAAIPKIPLGVVNDTGFLSSANYLINPDDRRKPRPEPNQGRDNFLVDLKTGSIVMVLEAELIAEMKALLKRLDVPKRMVQIEVMLVEQVLMHRNDIGLNLLQIGSLASQCNDTSLLFNAMPFPIPGITDFIVRRAPNSNIPAYDISYRFLISRDDIRINASPSVLTMNETEATIEFEEEISVSVGTFIVPNAGTATLQESFARARYGIMIDVVPTIHMHDPDSPCDDGIDYITLDSDVKFETVASNFNNQPNVIRRTLQNQARIADGQTVIIGGFRRKGVQDSMQAIPFLGEIPGFGKLFSNNTMQDTSIETFLFLTAKIVSDPLEDLEMIKMEEMARRPGDYPYFMKALREAREEEENRLLRNTVQLLFGREPERFINKEECIYNGRG